MAMNRKTYIALLLVGLIGSILVFVVTESLLRGGLTFLNILSSFLKLCLLQSIATLGRHCFEVMKMKRQTPSVDRSPVRLPITTNCSTTIDTTISIPADDTTPLTPPTSALPPHTFVDRRGIDSNDRGSDCNWNRGMNGDGYGPESPEYGFDHPPPYSACFPPHHHGEMHMHNPGPPAMLSFKAFVLNQDDDSITIEDAVKKYAEYKQKFKRSQ